MFRLGLVERLPLSYVFKRLVRSWQLYIALFLGVVLASTFFAGINVGADTTAKQALDQALDKVPVDFYASGYYPLTSQNITNMVDAISTVPDVNGAEAISRTYPDIRVPGENYLASLGWSEYHRRLTFTMGGQVDLLQ